MSVTVKRAFSAGEIDPSGWGRSDQVRHSSGLQTQRNFLGSKLGGVHNRPGTQYKGVMFEPDATSRLVKWIFNSSQTYLLEFSNLKLTFWRNGSPVLEASKNITAATAASPCQLTVASHSFSVGDKIYVSGVVGMTDLNGRYFKVRGVVDANNITLDWAGDGTADGTALNSSGFTAYSSGGTVERVYSITTTYVTADLSSLKFAQSADTMVIVHTGYAPRKLTRTAHTSWTLAIINFTTCTSFPTGGAATAGAAGGKTFNYMVTATDEAENIESFSGSAHTRTVSGITKASPAVVTVSSSIANVYRTGDEVIFTTVSGMTELSDRRFRISVLSSTTFSLVGEDSTNYGTFTSGSVFLAHINLQSAKDPTINNPITVTTNAAVADGYRYDVYREVNGVFGWIGTTYSTSFLDSGLPADTLHQPPIYSEPFQGSGNWPGCACFHQQRLVLAGSTNAPNFVRCLYLGDMFNISVHAPSQDNDMITFQTAGSFEQIMNVTSLGDKLVLLSTGGEWVVTNDTGSLRPTDIIIRPETSNGSGTLHPIPIDTSVLYIQDRSQELHQFRYGVSDSGEGWQSDDLTMWSRHLFKGYTIVDWGYQRSTNVLWLVRSDGKLITLTYVPSQQLFNIGRHDLSGGTVENVCVVPEGSGTSAEDVVYFIVKRTLQSGSTTRYLERIASRDYTVVQNAIFMDSALTYDGTGTGTVTLSSSGGQWLAGTSITCTFGTAQSITSGSVLTDQVHINGTDDDGESFTLKCTITGFTSTTVVTVKPDATVPLTMRGVAQSTWEYAPDTFTGLHHLEGKQVSVFGDGVVVASAGNPRYTDTYTVLNGSITLHVEDRYGRVTVGLPITADIRTLPFNPIENPRLMSKMKNLNIVAFFVSETRGLWLGARPPSEKDYDPVDVEPTEGLYQPKLRTPAIDADPTATFTGVAKTRVRSRYDRVGEMFLRQLEPLPVSVLSLVGSGVLAED